MRRPAQAPQRAQKASVVSFAPPTQGWICNQNIALAGSGAPGAVVLDNFWPTPQAVRIRRGCILSSQLGTDGTDCAALMTYDDGTAQKMFGATQTTIWDITSPAAPVVAADSFRSGDWSYTQFATTGGVFIVAVNGADPMQLFDGSRWWSIGADNILRLPLASSSGAFNPGDTVTGVTSEATGTVIVANTSEIFVTSVNGKDFTAGETVNGAASATAVLATASEIHWAGISSSNEAIAKIETNQFAFVWVYMNRLYFIERGSLNIWYLTIDSIGGKATLFPMGGVFAEGGALMLGSSWSLDNSQSGGLSEQCVMITDAGEVAVYQGVDPGLASSWGKVGLYRIDKPRGPRAFIRNGGDLLIATDTGLIPLTQAVNRSVNTLSAGASSYPIQEVWAQYVAERPARNWQVTVWPEKQMVAVAVSASDSYQAVFLVMNINTGAWARFTNWEAKSFGLFQGQLYFGSTSGRVVAAWQTGNDMGQAFTGVYVPLFTDLGGTSVAKMPKDCRVMLRGTYDATWQVTALFDYVLDIPPSPAVQHNSDVSVWDIAIWDESRWNITNDLRSQAGWTPLSGMGHAVAPCLQITSGNILPYDNEIIRLDVTYVGGQLLS